MHPALGDLVIPLAHVNLDALLVHWRWLLSPELRPLYATLLGDLFLESKDGQVLWLDVGSGALEVVAKDREQFEKLLTDPENVDLWFGRPLVDSLRKANMNLNPGECYSHQMLPILGGEHEPANFRIVDLQTHFDTWGPIHEKIKDLPDGTTIELKVVE